MTNGAASNGAPAAADNAIAALVKARTAFDEYYRASDKAHNGSFNDLGIEARKRVGQMIWLLSEVGRYLSIGEEAQRPQMELGSCLQSGEITPEQWTSRMQSPEMREALRQGISVNEPLETLTESFYWIAARARGVIRQLPNMGGFEAEGVRNTRNKLLEHADGKDSRVLITSFSWGADRGPVVKAMRFDHQAKIWPDQGLFVNATEFANELHQRSEKAAAAIS